MSERQIIDSLEEAGFTEAQVEALIGAFTLHHHVHPVDEILGLEDRLQELDEIAEECETSEDDEE